MPILQQFRPIFNQPIRFCLPSAAPATARCRPLVRSTTQDLDATEGVVAVLIRQSASQRPLQWEWIRDDSFRLGTPVGRWRGLRSEKRRRNTSVIGDPNLADCRMAASIVATPVPHKLDSIPYGVPLTVAASESARPDAIRKSRLTVVGHRGCGKNDPLSIGDVPGTRLSVRENTIRSFNLAANNGAEYAEFDVQVTKDGHPVIFHDDLILSGGEASKIGDLTLDEFLAFGPQKDGKHGRSLDRRQEDGTVKPWTSTLEDRLCTLKDAFELVEPVLGFNIEVKFHNTAETPEHELKRVISAILADVENYSNGRSIYFSSFHPDGAILLREDQNTYPVYMLTGGGLDSVHADPRRNSVEAAIEVCVQNGLQGVVSEVLAILKKPQLASQVKNAGLKLFTYGDMNNVAEAVVQQYNLDVDGVIVDCVREIVTASRTLHALLNFVQPDWSQFFPQGTLPNIRVN